MFDGCNSAFSSLSRSHHEGDTAVEPWMFGNEAMSS